jgi:hypothetical protein
VSTELEPSVIDKVLLAIVASGGSPEDAYVRLVEDDIDLPVEALVEIKREHPERYRQLDEQYGRSLEIEVVLVARQNALRSSEIERKALDRVDEALDADKLDSKDLAQLLRATADTKAKSVDKVLALTGRPVDGKTNETDMGQLLKVLVDRGVFNVAEPKKVDAEAQVEDAA